MKDEERGATATGDGVKIALVTMALTADHRSEWAEELTFPRMREYAGKYGMDFVVLKKTRRDLALGDIWDWERADGLYDLAFQYQRILHMDDDVIVRKDAEDISGLPFGTFYGFDNAPSNPAEVRRCWHQAQGTWREFRPFPPMKHLYNNGMFVMDSSHRDLFVPTAFEPCNVNSDQSKPSHYKGMGLMNARLHALGYPSSHRPDLFGVSYQHPKPSPSFLHVLWYDGPKEQGVREFIKEMDS